MPKKADILFEVDGFEVVKGNTYSVKHRPDSNAPSGLQQEGTTKIPTKGASDVFQAPYHYEDNDPTNGVWDSGMTEYSPCYRNLSPSVAKSTAKALYEKVGKPYERSIGKVGVMVDLANADDFWKNLDFSIEAKTHLNMDKPLDALKLYMALRKRVVMPEKNDGKIDPKYARAAFKIVDVTQNIKVKDERANAEFEAVANFVSMSKNNIDMLYSIMKWIGLRPSKTAEKAVLMSMFKDHLAPPKTTLKRIAEFNDLVEQSGDDIGQAKLLIFDRLDKLSFEGKVKKSTVTGEVLYDGEPIGLDLKDAAHKIATDKNLQDLKQKLILGEDS